MKDSRFALSHLGCVYYGNPSKDLLVVGVTGTKKVKTTTCHMVKEFLDSIGYRTGLIGTVHNIIGGRSTSRLPTQLRNLWIFWQCMRDGRPRLYSGSYGSFVTRLGASRVAHVQFDVGGYLPTSEPIIWIFITPWKIT